MLKVFGIYVTSAAASSRPVESSPEVDPSLAEQKQITFKGVRKAKLLLEAGFLVSRLREMGDVETSNELKRIALELVKVSGDRCDEDNSLPRKVHELSVNAWRKHFKTHTKGHSAKD